MLLQNKTVLVTGATRGIGRAVCEACAEQGARLIVTGRNEALLADVVAAIPGAEHLHYVMDVTNDDNVKAVFDDLLQKKIFVDCIVNNAGVMIDATLQMATMDVYEQIYKVNVQGSISVAQKAIKHMLRKRSGSIINLSSIIGTNGNAGQTIYGSSKSAIIGFTKSLSKELAPLGIRVNAVAPGFIDTDMTAGMDEKFYKKNVESIGMRRIGTPQDVARVVVFLASDLSGYVTGQVIGVDGGMVI
jgi:3-oxoacyl-[acyl-carrier protein] reductase